MSFKFPFTNYHELNLTWVLDKLKELFEESAENVSVIETYDGRLTAVETELPTVSETASEASRGAAAAATLAQTAKATADTAQENAIQAQRAAGTAQNTAERAQEAADAATQAAQQAQATAQNFDGRVTQAENDSAAALEASRSFENRVQSAITTANNAARTATDAQGVAQNANQNAAAALDKIGDLSALDTTAKQNLVAAINEALENGGKVDSVNGQTGAVVLDAGDIGYNNTTVESALDGKQNAPTAAGTAGQVLGLDSELKPVWINQSGGGETLNIYDMLTARFFTRQYEFSRYSRKISIKGNKMEVIHASGSEGDATRYLINLWGEAVRVVSGTSLTPLESEYIDINLLKNYIGIVIYNDTLRPDLLSDGIRFYLADDEYNVIANGSYGGNTNNASVNIGNLYSFISDYPTATKIALYYYSRNASTHKVYFYLTFMPLPTSASTTALALALDK